MFAKKYYFFLLVFSLLFFGKEVNAQDTILKSGTLWKYYDKGDLANTWFKNQFISKNWKSGRTPIGYGDDDLNTVISFGDDEDKKHITNYFTKELILEDPLQYIAYEIKVQRDDGIAIYLNGKEIYRNNLPNGNLTNKTFASFTAHGSEEIIFHNKIIDSKDLKKGRNIIAVSIHQSNQRSSDCIFNMEIFGHNNPRILSALLDDKSITNTKLETQIKDLSHQFQLENTSTQVRMLESSNDNLKFTLFIISFLLIITIIAALVLFLNYRKNLESSNQKILELNQQQLNKEKEMMSLSTKLLHNKQHFKELKADIKGITTSDSTSIKNITQHIDSLLDQDEEWENLEKHFNSVYSGFYDSIIKKHPTLTETELRHCMFIKLHMQTKEISRILLVDPRSVQTARYRIKKKMNLDENQDLREYLLAIS